jgi:hypothetical protein
MKSSKDKKSATVLYLRPLRSCNPEEDASPS